MNKFSVIGKFVEVKINVANNNYKTIFLKTSSFFKKDLVLPIICRNHANINKLKIGDLIGVHGHIGTEEENIILMAEKIIWLPNK